MSAFTSSVTSSSSRRRSKPVIVRMDSESLPSPPSTVPRAGISKIDLQTTEPIAESSRAAGKERRKERSDGVQQNLTSVDDPLASPTLRASSRRKKIQIEEQSNEPPDPLWNAPDNPFIAKRDEEVLPKPVEKPKNMVYVFRGKRVVYDVPFEALLEPEDLEDLESHTRTAPKLLFPSPSKVASPPPNVMPDMLESPKRKPVRRQRVTAAAMATPKNKGRKRTRNVIIDPDEDQNEVVKESEPEPSLPESIRPAKRTRNIIQEIEFQ